LIKEPSEVRILRLVRDRGEISRIEIAKVTNLHKASITDHVARLIKAGFLEETGKVESHRKVGRRRVLLKFRPQAGLVVGVDIRMTSAVVALTDLNAQILREEFFEYAVETSAEEVLTRVAATIQRLLTSTKNAQSRLLGIGIGVQGVIDYATNVLVVSHNKRAWQGQSLSTLLESKFRVPVYVENDVKTMTLGEYLFGSSKGTKDSVLVWVGTGVGAGIMINGRLHHGVTSSAGEIGYNGLEFSAVEKQKFRLTYREQQIFGEILTDANLVESYRRTNAVGAAESVSVQTVAQKAREGDEVAVRIIEEFASLLNILCINIVNTLNPEVIVLGGELAQSYPEIAGILEEKIHQDLLTPPAEAVRVRPAKHENRGVILGAVGLVLYELFEPLHGHSVRAARRHSILEGGQEN
jgi:predicted NBD/HSP70 family sugar kinase